MAVGALTKDRRFSLAGVPVLVYHGIGDDVNAGKYCVSLAQFRQHLRLIQDLGFRVVTLEDVVRATAPERAVVLTFDDGGASDYEAAFPALQEAGMSAEFFVSTANVGRPGYVTWAQISAMHAAGMRFGSHGHEHIPLTVLPVAKQEEQLRRSRSLLEHRLSAVVRAFSIPFGFVNEGLRSAARAAGFTTICTSRQWLAQRGESTVSRAGVYRHTSEGDFVRLLVGAPLLFLSRMARAAALYLPKQALLRLRPMRFHNRLEETRA